MAAKFVWVYLFQSESGDTYTLVFGRKPSVKKLWDTAMELMPNEFEDDEGPGERGGYLFLKSFCREPVL